MTLPAPEQFVTLGVLTHDMLKSCLDMQQDLSKKGVTLDLPHVILQMGLATAEQISRVLAHGKTADIGCPVCKRRFKVPDFVASRRYKCEPCKSYLEVQIDESLQPPDPNRKAAPAAPAATPAVAVAAKKDPFEGKPFGPYTILHRLGKGGMGAVYLGEHRENGQKFAIKILTEEFSRMPGIQARFKREGTASQRLEHPAITKTYEMASEGPYAYIVMEYVDGGDLVNLVVKEKKCSPERTVTIIGDVLDGLHHAHEQGLIHRDIKPANILLTTDLRGKLIDFGLAKDAEANTILTMAGSVMGTPAYMSPEQATGETAGPASDQYSCGIVAFLMLTGKKPFEGKGLVETLNKQLKDPLPSIRALNPDVPEALEKVIVKMTAKQPDKRYKSPGEAANAMRKAIGVPVEEKKAAAASTAAGGEGAAAAPAASGVRWIWVAVAAAAAVAAGVASRFLFK